MSALWREFTVEGADFLVFVSDDGMVQIGERTITQFNGKKNILQDCTTEEFKADEKFFWLLSGKN